MHAAIWFYDVPNNDNDSMISARRYGVQCAPRGEYLRNIETPVLPANVFATMPVTTAIPSFPKIRRPQKGRRYE